MKTIVAKISATMLSDWSRLLHSAVTRAKLTTGRLRLDRAAMLAVVFSAGAARAQWSTESYPLKAGWNAIWLSIDCSDRSIDTLLAARPEIEEVWQWNATASAVQFTDSPAAPVQADSQWKVWKRGVPAQTTLGNLTANAAYLVKVATGTANYALALTGRPEPPRYLWKSSGVNFLGFPIAETAPSPATQRSFTEFFKHNPVLNQNPPVFYYNGGDIAVNPRRLVTANSTLVTRGHAYWVQTSAYTDYYGPLQVTAGTDGLDFGDGGAVNTVRIKNVTTRAVTVTLKPVASAAPPGSGAAYPAVAGQVPLKLRGAINPATLEFTYTPVTTAAPAVVVLAAGADQEVVFGVDRTLMGSTAGAVYQSVLQITDSIDSAPALTRIDLPVRAVTTSLGGLWVGAAVLDSVSRVEIITGPETDSPGAFLPTTTTNITETTTAAVGATPASTTIDSDFDAIFDASGNVDLGSSGVTVVKVAGISGTPVYTEGTDYTVAPSTRATVTSGGSGYTKAPKVELEGGGNTRATATATLAGTGVGSVAVVNPGTGYSTPPIVTVAPPPSGVTAVVTATVSGGSVTGFTVTTAGSGYPTAPVVTVASPATATATLSAAVKSVTVAEAGGGSGYPASSSFYVAFTGQGGSGGRGLALVNDGGKVIDVAVVTGGSGYSSPPTVDFTARDAAGTVTITAGAVTGVDITNGGTGYTVAPGVSFVGAGGSGAVATAQIANGRITGVTISSGGSGYPAGTTNVVFTPAAGGSGASASTEISGSVASVTINTGGSGYTSVPTIRFIPDDGEKEGSVIAASATAALSAGGNVIGVDSIQKKAGGGIIGNQVQITTRTTRPAAAGTAAGVSTTRISSFSTLITANGRSHLRTRRITEGSGGGAAPSNFPVRLLLHVDAARKPTLLQQVYLGQLNGVNYAGPTEAGIAALVNAATPGGKIVRVSSASFPHGGSSGGPWAAGAGGTFGGSGTASFSVVVPFDARTNPFVHTYHPDHDNWDARYEKKLPAGQESHTVTRDITLTFQPTPPAGVSPLGWGVTTVGGTYEELITGLRAPGQEIGIRGSFILQQVSTVPTLTNP